MIRCSQLEDDLHQPPYDDFNILVLIRCQMIFNNLPMTIMTMILNQHPYDDSNIQFLIKRQL